MITATEPLRELVDQSLDEAAFFWKRWESDLGSLTRSLEEVWSWTEDRLHGALDGVRVAGEGLVEVTRAALHGRDTGALTIAAHLLAGQSPPAARHALADAVRHARGPRLEAIARGIETAELDGSFAPVTAVLASVGPEHSAALCRIKAFRRSPPGRELDDALASGVPALQAAALRSLGVATDEALTRHIEWGLRHADAAVRCAAIDAGLRRRLPEAWAAAVQLTEPRQPDCAPFLPALAALGLPEERQLVTSALHEPALQRAGLFALAYLGTPEAVEICLAGMRNPELARCAGEAYCAITGAELARDGLAAREPPDRPSPTYEDDALDADLVPAASDLWPLPDLDAVRRHWQRIKPRFGSGARHWGGRPVDLGTLIEAVEQGPMLRRADLAREIAIRTNGLYDVEPRAFAQVQRRMMQAARARSAEAAR